MFNWFHKLGLRVKATLGVLIIVGMAIAANSVVTLYQSFWTVDQMTQRAARLNAIHLAQVSSWPLQTGNQVALTKTTRQATYHQDILFAAIYNADHKLLSFHIKDHDAWLTYQRSPNKLADSFVKATFPVRPVVQISNAEYPASGSASFGYVTIGYSTNAMHHAQTMQLIVMIAMFVLTASTAGLIVFKAVGRWTTRLGRLVHASDRIANGDLANQIEEDGHDEIGRLGQACEKMRRAVQQRDRTMQRFNELLQEEVDMRTEQLIAAKESAEESALSIQETNQKLRDQARHDDLTGLPNRTFLMERLTVCMARAKQNPDEQFAILFMDMDRFKVVNDSLGHAAGDELLIQFAKRMTSKLSQGYALPGLEPDVIARIGGDEFVLLIESVADTTDVCRLAQQIEQMLAEPFQIAGQDVFTASSIGIVMGGDRYREASDILRDADMAMYHAKGQEHSGGYHLYDQTMHEQALMRLQLENDLRQAIDRKQFSLRFQPIVDLKSGYISGFEALVRWDHPELGMVSPVRFVPIADETGLIVPLGTWILRQACADLKRLQSQLPSDRPLTMNINLSKRQISEPGIVQIVADAIAEAQVDPLDIRLEITESVIMETADQLIPVLHEFAALGCQLHMDDFGTGYSSLSCLHRFPLDALKIDRAFIVNMTDDPRHAAIVNTIVMLANNLGMKVTAEGVETKEQLAQVLAMDCDHCQGYYFAKPLTYAQAGELLADNHMPFETLRAEDSCQVN